MFPWGLLVQPKTHKELSNDCGRVPCAVAVGVGPPGWTLGLDNWFEGLVDFLLLLVLQQLLDWSSLWLLLPVLLLLLMFLLQL